MSKLRGSWIKRRRCGSGRALVLLVMAGALGCESSVPRPDLVARVDGEDILYGDFERFLERNSVEDGAALGSDVLSALLDQLLEQRMVRRLAVDTLDLEKGIDDRQAVEALLAHQEIARIDQESVLGYYLQNRDAFERPERIHLRQLLLDDRSTAERIRAEWADGTTYREVLERFASSPGLHVGEEGEFTRQDLPPAFADTLFALGDGEVSEILAADYGFHVFEVVRRLPAGPVPLSDVSSAIRDELEDRRRQESLSALVVRARERYNVRVFEKNLPFNYVGKMRTDQKQTPP